LAAKKAALAHPGLRLAFIRQCHVYVSMFVAPSLIFFALTGALQTFRIPDQKTAPVLLQKLARAHKDDVFAVKPPRPKRPDGGGHGDHDKGDHAKDSQDQAGAPVAKTDGAKGGDAKPQPKPATEAVKWFFAIVSVAIAITTTFGIWMALAHHKRKAVMWVLLLAGAAAPVILLAL
jgi:hypothetical protein